MNDAERFATRVTVSPNGCHLWTGAIDADGYGSFNVNRTKVGAHIYAFGPVPEGHELDHQCHNADLSCPGDSTCMHRRCVNRDHIEAVTHTVNLQRRHERVALIADAARKAHVARVLAEELSPEALTPTPATYNVSEAMAANTTRAASPESFTANRWQPGQSGNPQGGALAASVKGYTLTRALREVTSPYKAKAVAETMYEKAAAGDVRAAEFIRDSTEGKPGVRIQDGEWNPDQATTYNVMAKYALMVQPQTTELEAPAD